MNYENILKKIGLSREESKIYIDLLENGISNIVEISNRTNINRPALYKIIPELLETNLISQIIKGKRRVFKAENPKNLSKIFENLSNTFNSIIPELEELYDSKKTKPNIRFFEGGKGLKFIYEDILNTLENGDIYYRYSSRHIFDRKYFPTDYNKKIDEKGIYRYLITSESLAKTKEQKAKREMVIIPKDFDLFEDNVSKVIYKNKVAIIDYNSMTGFIIENQIFSKFEEKLFKLLFKLMKK